MITLIGGLVILLVAVIVIALCIRPKNPAASNDPTIDTTLVTDPTQTAELAVTSPAKTEFVTVEQDLLLQGISDPSQPVLINGAAVTQNADGSFAHTLQLQPGKNQITVTHKDKTLTYNVEYRYAVQSFSPENQTTFNCGATIQVELLARSGSTMKVTLNGKVAKPSADVKEGDTIAITFGEKTTTVKVEKVVEHALKADASDMYSLL
jgi:hypothetical protein